MKRRKHDNYEGFHKILKSIRNNDNSFQELVLHYRQLEIGIGTSIESYIGEFCEALKHNISIKSVQIWPMILMNDLSFASSFMLCEAIGRLKNLHRICFAGYIGVTGSPLSLLTCILNNVAKTRRHLLSSLSSQTTELLSSLDISFKGMQYGTIHDWMYFMDALQKSCSKGLKHLCITEMLAFPLKTSSRQIHAPDINSFLVNTVSKLSQLEDLIIHDDLHNTNHHYHDYAKDAAATPIISKISIQCVLSKLSNLQRLELHGLDLYCGNGDCDTSTSRLCYNDDNNVLEGLNQSLQVNTSLKYLTLHNTNITNEDCLKIMKSLQKNQLTSLQELSLQNIRCTNNKDYHHIYDEIMTQITQLLTKNNTLRAISLYLIVAVVENNRNRILSAQQLRVKQNTKITSSSSSWKDELVSIVEESNFVIEKLSITSTILKQYITDGDGDFITGTTTVPHHHDEDVLEKEFSNGNNELSLYSKLRFYLDLNRNDNRQQLLTNTTTPTTKRCDHHDSNYNNSNSSIIALTTQQQQQHQQHQQVQSIRIQTKYQNYQRLWIDNLLQVQNNTPKLYYWIRVNPSLLLEIVSTIPTAATTITTKNSNTMMSSSSYKCCDNWKASTSSSDCHNSNNNNNNNTKNTMIMDVQSQNVKELIRMHQQNIEAYYNCDNNDNTIETTVFTNNAGHHHFTAAAAIKVQKLHEDKQKHSSDEDNNNKWQRGKSFPKNSSSIHSSNISNNNIEVAGRQQNDKTTEKSSSSSRSSNSSTNTAGDDTSTNTTMTTLNHDDDHYNYGNSNNKEQQLKDEYKQLEKEIDWIQNLLLMKKKYKK